MKLNEVRGILAQFPDLLVSPAGPVYVVVSVGSRRHRVRVSRAEDWLRIEGRVVHMPNLESAPRIRDVAVRLLQANHLTEFVGITRNDKDWLVARYDVPPEGEADDLADAIRRVARVADRWELLWTGGDGE